MGRKKRSDPTAAPLFDVRSSTAPCVPTIREKVDAWRLGGYRGATETSRRLLNWWFLTDHRLPDGRRFLLVTDFGEGTGCPRELDGRLY
jgi:hypothetical protein